MTIWTRSPLAAALHLGGNASAYFAASAAGWRVQAGGWSTSTLGVLGNRAVAAYSNMRAARALSEMACAPWQPWGVVEAVVLVGHVVQTTLFFWRALPGRPCAARLVAGASGRDRAWAPRPMISHRHALSRVVGWAPCSEASHLARSRQRGVEKSNLDHRHVRHDWRSGQGLQLPVGLAQALEARKRRSGPPPRRFASRYTTSGWEVVTCRIVGPRGAKRRRGAIRA